MSAEIQVNEQANAAYVRFAAGKVVRTVEEGEFTVDYSRSGKVLGVEILGLSEHIARNGGVFRIPLLNLTHFYLIGNLIINTVKF